MERKKGRMGEKEGKRKRKEVDQCLLGVNKLFSVGFVS